MSGITIIVELKPSSELMLLGDALVRAMTEMAEAIKSRTAQPIGASIPEGARPLTRAEIADLPEALVSELRNIEPETPLPDRASPPAAVLGTAEGIEQKVASPVAASTSGVTIGDAIKLKEHWATPERKAHLVRWYPTSVSTDSIVGGLSKLPGSELPPWNVISMYAVNVLKLKSGRKPVADNSGITKKVDRGIEVASDAFARAMRLPTGTPDTKTPIIADIVTIRARVAPWGIQFNGPEDLAAVNEKAQRIGHRPFQIGSPREARMAQ